MLASIYTDGDSARVVAIDAQIKVDRISFDGAIKIIWQAILEEAENQGQVDAILDVASEEYSRHPELQQACHAWRQQYHPEPVKSATLPPATPPPATLQPDPSLANYHTERNLFYALISEQCAKPILLIEGESGTGKTTLIQLCRQVMRQPQQQHFDCIAVQFRQATLSVADIFEKMRGRLAWADFPQFIHAVARLQPVQGASVEPVEPPVEPLSADWLAGLRFHLRAALEAQDPADRAYRHEQLTIAWVADMTNRTHPLLLLFDTFEDASDEVQTWVASLLLAHLVDTPTVRILVAGQTVPDHNRHIEWGDCANHRVLRGVNEANDWLPVAEALNVDLDQENPLAFLRGVCAYCKGHPAQIMEFLQTLPRREVYA